MTTTTLTAEAPTLFQPKPWKPGDMIDYAPKVLGPKRRAQVWSDGPYASSVWAIDTETGKVVMVRVPRGKTGADHEVEGRSGNTWY